MPIELIEALKAIHLYCAVKACDSCELSYWCEKEFGQRPPEEWVLPIEWE